MNVINEQSAGGRIGSSLGSGISKTLDMLTANRLNNLAERHQLQQQATQRSQESGALQSLGIPSHVSDAISNLGDQNLKRIILSNLGTLGGNSQGIEQSQTPNLFQNPADKYKQQQLQIKQAEQERKASEFQQMESRRAQESNAKLGEIGAKTELNKARSSDIVQERALRDKNLKLREDIAKVDERIALAKNDIERRKLEVQKDKLSKNISINNGKLETKQKFAEIKEINKANKPYNDVLDKQIKLVPELEKKVKEAKEIITGKKGGSRLSGYLPIAALGKESQRLNTISNDIVRLLGQNARTNAERKTIEDAKISLKQGRPAQLAAANDLENMIKLIKQQDSTRRKLIRENGGNQPANLASLVNEQLESNPAYIELQESSQKNTSKDQILEQPIGTTLQGPNGQYYTRVKYGSGLKIATPEEIRKAQNG